MTHPHAVDVLIVGAGMAGASLAWQLVQPGPTQRSVALLEMESQPGLHATGRSAAMFMESYGPPQARALTRAGRSFYESPPVGFCDTPLLTPRGAMYVARVGQASLLAGLRDEVRATGGHVDEVGADDVVRLVPVLRRELLAGGLIEPDARDMDVHALHQAYLRGARHRGATLVLDAELVGARHDGRAWQVELSRGQTWRTTSIVDAAGAWADVVAQRCGVAPRGIEPKRRSAFIFDAPPGVDIAHWPLVAGIDEGEGWYFKPDAGRLLGSPANADHTVPQDVRPEELDIAIGIARIEEASTLTIRRPRATWAGLRTFTRGGDMMIGADPVQPAFFWLVGQGGWGIQSAAGAAQLAASLLAGTPLPQPLADHGVSAQAVAPPR